MEQFLSRLLDASLQGVIAFAAVFLLVNIFHGLHPATKCWLWRLCGVKFIFSLVFIASLPLLEATQMPEMVPPIPSMPTDVIVEATTKATTHYEPLSTTTPDWNFLFPAIWGVGVIGVLTARIVKNFRLQDRLMQAATPYDGDSFGSPARLLVSSHLKSPVLVGVRKPAIIVPTEMVDQPDELRMAIAHEIAHIQRRDIPWQTVLSLITCLFWFLPPVYWIERMSKSEAELATDREVIESTGYPAVQYGRFLVRLARQSRENFCSLEMAAATRKSLERRIKAMSHSSTHRKSLLVAVAVLALPALIPWQAVAQEAKISLASNQRLDVLAKSYLFVTEDGNELEITDDQEKRLRDLASRHNREIRQFGQRLEDMKQQGVSDKVRLAYDQKVRMPMFHRQRDERWNVLTSAQKERQRQIVLQYLGPLVLGHKQVGKLVDLSPSQARVIGELQSDYHQFMKNQNEANWHDSNAAMGLRKVKIRDFTPKESKRLSQIQRERFAATGQKRIDLQNEYYKILAKGWRHEGRLDQPPKDSKQKRSDLIKELMAKRRQEFARLSAKAIGVLSAEQKKKWAQIQGKAMNFPQRESGGALVISYR